MTKKKPLDSDSAAALEVVNMEQMQEQSAEQQQATREQMIAQCHEMIGRIQGFKLITEFADVGNLVWLKQVKESKIYRDLPNLGSWDKFCIYIGLSRSKVDEDLANLAAFGEKFLADVGSFSLGYRELRKLRQLSNDGSVSIENQQITIGEESIPLDSDHHEDIQAAIEQMLDDKNEQIEDLASINKAKGRILQSKEQVINKQEKEISRHEARAEKKGFAPGEEAFLQEMDNSRVTFDGYLIRFDPASTPLPEEATPRMEAAYMESLGYFKRVIDAAYDTAADHYGHGEMDGGWVPPNLKVVNEGEE